jgi:aconitate hydratase
VSVHEAAQRYKEAGEAVVLVAGERYGTGSSRDWAAKAQRLLGIRAVLAVSFERIHRSNLVGMGILPLLLPEGMHPDELRLRPGDRIEVNAPAESFTPRARIGVRVVRANGDWKAFKAVAAVETQLEAELLRYGGVIPTILKKTLRPCSSPTSPSPQESSS